MSERPNRWILQLPESIDPGVDTACSCNRRCLYLGFLSIACVRGGFVMIVRAFGLWMRVGRFSRPLREVGVLAMPDAGLDTTPHLESVCEIPPGAGVEWLLVPGVAVGVFIDRHCAAGGVEVTCWVISAMPELFSEDERVEVLPWILEAVELPPWEESHSPAGVDTRPLPGGSWEFPESLHFCCFWSFRMSVVMWRRGLWKGIVRYRCSTLKM